MKNKTKKLVLKVGEGLNSHTLECKKNFEYENLENEIKVMLGDNGIIKHGGGDNDNHGDIIVEEGTWYVNSQMEYDPLIQNFRQVFD